MALVDASVLVSLSVLVDASVLVEPSVLMDEGRARWEGMADILANGAGAVEDISLTADAART
ncbi:hypothetical protein GCM10010488_10670 [Oerskovia jenensis]